MMGDSFKKVYNWLDERIGLKPIEELAKHKEVPVHRYSFWYYFGGMTLFLFSVQVITGMILLLYYRPSAGTAYESVRFITTQVHFGWLIRSIHSWSANLMVGALFVHMFSVYLLKSYRRPREITWLTGVLLLFVTLGFGFTGYLLPWNKLSFFATKVGTDIAGSIPIIGNTILVFLRGGKEVTGATLTRLFGFHVMVLPLTIFLILGIHLYLIQKHGMALPVREARKEKEGEKIRTIPFLPNFLYRDAIGWILVLGILVFLASVFPWELGEKADPLASAPAGIRPEWYFMFMFQTLKLIPSKVLFIEGELLGILGFTFGGLILFFVPFLDRKSNKLEENRLFTILGVLVILYMIVLTVWGYAV